MNMADLVRLFLPLLASATASWCLSVRALEYTVVPQANTPSFHLVQSERLSTFADVIDLVQRKGWKVKMGEMCAALEVPELGDCQFKQVSLFDDRNVGHGFNIPISLSSDAHYVVMFRLRPLVGEFFLVSADGQLLAASYRASGSAGYGRLAIEEAKTALSEEMTYWRSNVALFDQMLEAPSRQ